MANLTLDLYRSCKRDRRTEPQIQQSFYEQNGASSLYPDYNGFLRRDGTFRAPDVTTFTDGANVVWVGGVEDINLNNRSPAHEGVSLSTIHGKFGYSLWFYFLLP